MESVWSQNFQALWDIGHVLNYEPISDICKKVKAANSSLIVALKIWCESNAAMKGICVAERAVYLLIGTDNTI